MMYYVNKIVSWCLSPLGIGLVLILAGRFGRFGGIGLAFVWLWVFSCGFFTRWIGLPLEGEEVDVATLPSANAIVLLGGGLGLHDRCGRPEIVSGADRAWTAARLFRSGKASLLTVSGSAAKAEIAFLSDMGVDTNRIVVLDVARNTEEEARLIAQAISEVKDGGQGQQRNCFNFEQAAGKPLPRSARAKILLVTSAWHMPRAKMLFERAGFEVVPAPTDYEAHCAAESPLKVGDFFPNADALNRNSYLAKEWVARFCYTLKW